MKDFAGKMESKGLKIGIVVSRFNEMITEKLLTGALDTLRQTGIEDQDITLVRVPGSFEIPVASQRLAQTGKLEAIICLGAVIRGETPHFEYLSSQVAHGISQVALKYDLPVTFGVITADTVEQALARAAGVKHANKGSEAANSAVQMANLFKQLSEDEK
ncbi:MAG: 6,7-dimethyl-8-ribityllumazine synthase [Acidobacteria bacterium]|nr:6,7-dimethyl-8-ribityllumazine synthase [Acidobacteriota bacterium]MCZ6769857.1 6,7-dimethyl-8-ribityllumazine synthase [Acidobacteriota bacterium]MCZ6878008.1 6,7-dimethyl-8-ribityllumazine synthase [Acidobacteriota bacterium]